MSRTAEEIAGEEMRLLSLDLRTRWAVWKAAAAKQHGVTRLPSAKVSAWVRGRIEQLARGDDDEYSVADFDEKASRFRRLRWSYRQAFEALSIDDQHAFAVICCEGWDRAPRVSERSA